MTTTVSVHGLVEFSPTIGICVGANSRPLVQPDVFLAAVQFALDHWQDDFLVDACCGASGPLANLGMITAAEYLDRVARATEQASVRDAAKNVKAVAIRQRRGEFASRRAELVLAMLSSGCVYQRAIAGCGCHEDLTVDHIVPIARGGTDDLQNLQFMCRSHNSQKGAT